MLLLNLVSVSSLVCNIVSTIDSIQNMIARKEKKKEKTQVKELLVDGTNQGSQPITNSTDNTQKEPGGQQQAV